MLAPTRRIRIRARVRASLAHARRPFPHQETNTTHSFAIISCLHSSCRARSAPAPAGNPCICWPKTPKAGFSVRFPAMRNPIRAANTCSTMAGPRPTNALAEPIIRSCRSPCRLPRRPVAGFWSFPGRKRRRCRRRLPMRWSTFAAAPTRPRFTSPSRRQRNGSCWGRMASSCEPTSSSIGRMPAMTRSSRFLPRWPRASARPFAASAPTRSRPASMCSG